MPETIPITPPQGTPYQQEDNPLIFNRIWWLFFYSLAAAIKRLFALIAGLTNGRRPSVLDFGAKADLIFGFDGAIFAASHTLNSATASFTTADLGKAVWVEGAGTAGASDILGRISSINSSTSIEISIPASFTVAGARFRYGTDNLSAIQRAFDTSIDRGQEIYFPTGAYGIIGSLTPYNNLVILGSGYDHNSFTPQRAPSILVGLSNVPLINYTDIALLESFCVNGMAFAGTSRTGSKGIYLSGVFGFEFRDLAFDYFGDQAIHIEGDGFDGFMENCVGQDNLLVRTGRTDYVGGFDIRCADLIMLGCKNTTSVGVVNGVITGGLYGDGFGAGIAIRGANAFIHASFAHLSELGFYVDANASTCTFVDSRADLNQGEGWNINAGVGNYLGCRSHANSIDSNGSYDGFVINSAGCQFNACQNTYNGVGGDVRFNQVKNAFETTNDAATEVNHFHYNYIQPDSWTGAEYVFAGTQGQQVVLDDTNLDPGLLGRATNRNQGDLSVQNLANGDPSVFWIRDTTADANNRLWSVRINNPTNTKQLLHGVWTDNLVTESVYERITRSGTTVTNHDLLASLVNVTQSLQVDGNIQNGALTASRLVKTDGSKILVSAAAGFSGNVNVITNVTHSTDTIHYLDWSSNPQSETVVTDVTGTIETWTFLDGQRTA